MYKENCLAYAEIRTLPKIWDGETPFHRGIALCEMRTGRLDYIICGYRDGSLFVAKTFDTGLVHNFKEVYPYDMGILHDAPKVIEVKYDDIITTKEDSFYGVTGINTVEQAQSWLRANGINKGILSDKPEKLKARIAEILENKTIE